MLTLNLRRIRDAHERFEQVYEPAALGAESNVYRVVEPARLAMDVFKDQDRFRLVGSVQTTFELACSRCLEPFTWPVDAAFDLQYQPKAAYTEHEERAIGEADFSAAYYEDETIDLGQLMAEQLHLSLPMKPLCREECLGLCPQCGTNLNRSTCDCRRDWEDPRLTALRTFKRDS